MFRPYKRLPDLELEQECGRLVELVLRSYTYFECMSANAKLKRVHRECTRRARKAARIAKRRIGPALF